MSSKLKEIKGKTTISATTTTSSSTETKGNKEPPEGAKILSKTVRTESEEIENGWILSKNYDVSYEIKGERNYSYYTKKWYSESNPITVTVDVTDKSLAEEFED